MKVKISLVFIAIYLFSLVLIAPASLITRFIPNNAGIQIGNISGTLWNGKLSQVDYRRQFQLQRLNWKMDWLALFSLKLKADIHFSNGRQVMSGSGAVEYGLSGIVVSDVNVDMQATALLPYLQLPVPVEPSGKFSLVIENGTPGAPYCEQLDGYLVWHGAKVDSLMGNIDLATPSLDLSCEAGNLVATLKQHSEQITTNANISLKEGGSYQLEGNIMGREKLDPSILQALSLLGPKQESGEILFNFKGRL